MTKKQKKQKALAEDKFIQGLPQPFKAIIGAIKYNFKEIITILFIILLGLFILFNVSWDAEHGLIIKPGIKAEIKKEL